MKKIILFSHGMGLLKDNRGFFPYLIERINAVDPTIECHLFDYNDINEAEKTVYVKPFSEQARELQRQIDTITSANEGARLFIIGQSQGSLIPAFCDLTSVYKVIGFSPFFHTDMKDIMARYTKSGENDINFTGMTKRKRTDGTTTLMPASYWQERFVTKPEALYNSMALATRLTLICGLQDEIMDITNLTKIKNTRIINTDSNHDFNGQYRVVAERIVLEELSY